MAETAAADVTGWGIGWPGGWATEKRPPWGYAQLLALGLGEVSSALDMDPNDGEDLTEIPTFPLLMLATEAGGESSRRLV